VRRRRNFARASGHDTPPPILSIGKGDWHGSGNGGGNATAVILCTGNSSWNGSANSTLLIPSIGKRSWNGSENATPASENASGKSKSAEPPMLVARTRRQSAQPLRSGCGRCLGSLRGSPGSRLTRCRLLLRCRRSLAPCSPRSRGHLRSTAGGRYRSRCQDKPANRGSVTTSAAQAQLDHVEFHTPLAREVSRISSEPRRVRRRALIRLLRGRAPLGTQE